MTTVDRKQLKNTLMQAKRAAGTRGPLPALAGVRLTAEPGRLVVEATDLELAFRDTLDAEGDDTWQALPPVQTLHGLVGKLSGDTVTLEPADDGYDEDSLSADRLSVTGERADLAVRNLQLEDYPEPPKPATGVETSIPCDALKAALTATSADYTRPVLTGVYLDGPEGVAVATDSHRLVQVELPETFDARALVPGDTVRRVLQAKPGDKVAVAIDANETSGTGTTGFVTFTSDDGRRTWTSRLIEGRFPNYAGLFPDQHEASATVEASRLAEACDRVGSVMAGKANSPAALSMEDGKLSIFAKNREVGELSERIPATGDLADIAVNPKLGKELADLFDGDVTVETRDAMKPLVLDGDGPVKALLMPMRVN